jgi:hypothetical protein
VSPDLREAIERAFAHPSAFEPLLSGPRALTTWHDMEADNSRGYEIVSDDPLEGEKVTYNGVFADKNGSLENDVIATPFSTKAPGL